MINDFRGYGAIQSGSSRSGTFQIDDFHWRDRVYPFQKWYFPDSNRFPPISHHPKRFFQQWYFSYGNSFSQMSHDSVSSRSGTFHMIKDFRGCGATQSASSKCGTF
jgi:hypothetical protein